MFLQFFLIFLYLAGFAVNGINNVNTTSYERRFQLASSQVAWISSSFDIAAAIFGVIIGFYGNRRHKARILTVAFFVASLGSLCMFLPHFITGLYQWGQTTLDTCSSTPGKFYLYRLKLKITLFNSGYVVCNNMR